jgi:adenosylcobinamide-phosphate synthase
VTFLYSGFAVAALALLIENLTGYPKALYNLIGHPVEWMGKFLQMLEAMFRHDTNSPQKNRLGGILALFFLCVVVALPAILIQRVSASIPYGWFFSAFIATPFLAQKSLRDHVNAVSVALPISIKEARHEVAKIVGRNTDTLDESGICKAALESLAENTADGVVAPALWYAIAGLPGLVVYKAINTADSMIGHRSERYLYFGQAAAKIDDLVNLPASRLTGGLFALTAFFESTNRAKMSWRMMCRDARKHNSPNAGWPEAAMAGALGLKFGGPRNYADGIVDLPYMGNGKSEQSQADLVAGLNLFDQTTILLAAAFGLLAIFL